MRKVFFEECCAMLLPLKELDKASKKRDRERDINRLEITEISQ